MGRDLTSLHILQRNRVYLDSATFGDVDGNKLKHGNYSRVWARVAVGERSLLRLGVKLLCRNGLRTPHGSNLALSS